MNADVMQDNIVPVDRDGYMLINWQHRIYDESFKHIPVISLLNLAASHGRKNTNLP